MAVAARWKVWYDTPGLTYSDQDGPAENAPTDGIVAIVEKQADKTVRVYEGYDYYFWTGENWAAGNQCSMERWLRAALPALKFGRWTKDGMFKQVMEEIGQWQ